MARSNRRQRRRRAATAHYHEVDFTLPAGSGMLIAVGYSRLSKKDLDEGYSIEMQTEDIHDRSARETTWDFRGFYVDYGHSAYAKRAWDRPDFNRMLEDAKAGKFQVLLIHRVNRLARDTEVSLKTARELKEMGIKVIFVRENIDFDAPGAQQEFTKLALNAEEYSAGIAADVNRSIRYKLDRGEAWGRPPFGYQICDDDCPDDDEHPFWHQHDVKAPLVKAMFERYDKGDSLAQIARWLNSSGHKTNKMNADMSGVVIEGNAFRSESVGYILRNRKYIGFAKNPRGGTDERTASHKPIVSKALFESVNSRLLKNTAKREAAGRKSKSARILSRIVHCYICDSQYSVSTGGKGRDYHLRRKNGADCICKNTTILAKYVERDLDLFLKSFEMAENWQLRVETALNNEIDTEEVEATRKSLLDDRRRINFQYRVAKTLDDEQYLAELNEVNNRLGTLERPAKERVTKAGEYLENFQNVWNTSSDLERNSMLHKMLEAIYFDPESRRIHSIVPRQTFAAPFRNMAERDDVTLRQFSDLELEANWKLRDARGYIAQFPVCALKIHFSHHLALENLAERIETKRVKSLMTRVALAGRLDVSTNSIFSWENGATPGIEFHERIAAWLADPLPEWTKLLEEETIGQRIKDQRQAWGLSQVELGERLRVSAAAIGSCEQGSTPSMQTLAKLGPWLAERAPARRVKRTNSDFGARLQKKRMMIGMSQTALGKYLGVDKAQIRRWEECQSLPSKAYAEMTEEWLSNPEDYTLSQRIRDKRKSLFMTQKDVATALGVSLFTLKNWENLRAFPSKTNLLRVITWLSRGYLHHKQPETQPEFTLFVLPMKEKRERLGIGTMTLALHLGVGKNRVREWEEARSIPSEAGCRKIGNWLEAA